MNYSTNIFRMSVQKFSLLAVTFCVLLASCGNEPSTSNKTKQGEQTKTKEATTTEVEQVIYPLPTPYEISTMLNKAGAGYIFNVSNPVDNVDKYFTEKSKALNLGVYGADLSYASTYNKSEETQLFLTCTKQLTDDLGINSILNEDIVERVEANIDNKDSLHSIISESYYDTFSYLNKNGKGSISVLVLAGGWIEGMYLSTQLAIITNNDAGIMQGIFAQKANLNKLYTIFKSYKDDPNVTEVLTELEKIKIIMDSITSAEISTEIQEKLTAEVEIIRASIVE